MFGSSVFVDGSFSLENYQHLFTDSRQLILFKNSIILSLSVSLLSVIIGVPLAFLIARTDIYFRRYLKYLYLLPILIPPYISAIAWIHLLGTKGSINELLSNILSLNQPIFTIYGIKGCIFVLTLSYFPFVTLLTISGLNSLDERLENAARLSAGEMGVLKRITLPLIFPYILAGATFIFIFTISEYGVPALLRVNTYPVEIFSQFSALYNEKAAVASSFPLVAITIVLILLQKRYMRNRPYITIGSASRSPYRIRLGKLKAPAAFLVFLIMFLSIFLPIGELIVKSGSLSTYAVALKTGYKSLITTLILSICAATLILPLAFFISYRIERGSVKRKGILELLSILPFAIPGTVLGIGLIKVWNRPLTSIIYGTSAIIIFAYISRFVPFVIQAISSNLRQIHTHLEESAAISGAGWFRRLTKVTLPLSRPGLIAGWAVAFILCLGELPATLLIIPPGKETLSLRTYSILHYGAGQLVDAFCIILLIAAIIPLCLLLPFLKRSF